MIMDSILNSNSPIANKKSGRRSGISSLFVKLSTHLTGRLLINSAIRTRNNYRDRVWTYKASGGPSEQNTDNAGQTVKTRRRGRTLEHFMTNKLHAIREEKR